MWILGLNGLSKVLEHHKIRGKTINGPAKHPLFSQLYRKILFQLYGMLVDYKAEKTTDVWRGH